MTVRWAAPVLLCVALACAKDTASRKRAAVDTLSDSAATASAKALSRAPAGTAVTLTVTGKDSYDGPVNERATCTYGQENGAPQIKIEAFGRDAQVAFEIIHPIEGTIPVRSGYNAKHPTPRVSSLQFVLHSQTYGAGTGTATITDPLGRVGTLSAAHFSRVGLGRRHGSDLKITVHWECE